jgi:hypothetical protein
LAAAREVALVKARVKVVDTWRSLRLEYMVETRFCVGFFKWMGQMGVTAQATACVIGRETGDGN